MLLWGLNNNCLGQKNQLGFEPETVGIRREKFLVKALDRRASPQVPLTVEKKVKASRYYLNWSILASIIPFVFVWPCPYSLDSKKFIILGCCVILWNFSPWIFSKDDDLKCKEFSTTWIFRSQKEHHSRDKIRANEIIRQKEESGSLGLMYQGLEKG